MYDYAEDYVMAGEPSFGDVATVADVRRAYFLDVQNGVPSSNVLDPDTLPDRECDADGIVWLPRIIVKARAKLKGELDPDTMYGCGSDRSFLKLCDIHPAEFLRKVWEHDDYEVIRWVAGRAKKASL